MAVPNSDKEFRVLDWISSISLAGVVAIVGLMWSLDHNMINVVADVSQLKKDNQEYVTKESLAAQFAVFKAELMLKYDGRFRNLEQKHGVKQ